LLKLYYEKAEPVENRLGYRFNIVQASELEIYFSPYEGWIACRVHDRELGRRVFSAWLDDPRPMNWKRGDWERRIFEI
jgi:hypothetical protein